MMSEVESQVKQIVVDHLGIDEAKVTAWVKIYRWFRSW